MTSGQLPAPFMVSVALVEDIKALVQNLASRSRSSNLTVTPAEFPAWLVALGKEDFHAQRTRSGMTFVRAGYTLIGDDPVNSPMVSVTCDTPPAPWVSFPGGEGTRRYMFRYNLLSDNETESSK